MFLRQRVGKEKKRETLFLFKWVNIHFCKENGLKWIKSGKNGILKQYTATGTHPPPLKTTDQKSAFCRNFFSVIFCCHLYFSYLWILIVRYFHFVMILNFRFLFFLFFWFSASYDLFLLFCMLCVKHSFADMCMWYCENAIICRFCLFFCFLLDVCIVLVLFIVFVFYVAKMSLKTSRVYFFCYLVIFNIKKFAFLRNSSLLCGVKNLKQI